MSSDLGTFVLALAALCVPLVLAWGIVSWQGRPKKQQGWRRR